MEQAVIDAAVELLPEDGEMSFDDWKTAAAVSGQNRLIKQFHRLRRAGHIAVRYEDTGDVVNLWLSRPEPVEEGE